MSLLSQVTHSSNKPIGIRAVIAGVEKVGKTTFTCSAPRPLLIPLEMGVVGIQVTITPQPQSFDDVIQLLNEIIESCGLGTFIYHSIIFDSATALERLIHDKTIQSDASYKKGAVKRLTMEEAHKGYGKAYGIANDYFGDFLAKCDVISNLYGINVIFTSHVFVTKIIDPAFGEYDAWDLLLHSPKNNKTYGKREMLTQWADIIGFLHEPLFISKENGSNLSRGVSANKGRVLGLERTPGYVAGNRFGIKGEITIPAEGSWNYLAQAIHEASGLDVYNRD